jgi:hypothetical protein
MPGRRICRRTRGPDGPLGAPLECGSPGSDAEGATSGCALAAARRGWIAERRGQGGRRRPEASASRSRRPTAGARARARGSYTVSRSKGRWWARWVRRVGRHGVGDKKIIFWQKRSPNCNFYNCSTFLSSRNPTGGSDVRGTVGPIWVKKIFNCLRSL